MRESAVEVTHLDTGAKGIYPFGDIGPGKDGLAHGYGMDLTVPAMLELGGKKAVANGSIRVAYKILPGYYARKTGTLLAKR